MTPATGAECALQEPFELRGEGGAGIARHWRLRAQAGADGPFHGLKVGGSGPEWHARDGATGIRLDPPRHRTFLCAHMDSSMAVMHAKHTPCRLPLAPWESQAPHGMT